ncbi:MAG TPA: DUF4403 family protein [Pseudolabrys sp.]|nr:DUF4403 family protein [Pseudolabrys sp.]
MHTVIYYLTAPFRMFGRSRAFRLAVGAAVVVLGFFFATLWALNRFVPPADSGLPEALAIMQQPPPLQPVTRASHVIAPVAVALTAIGHSLDATTPRDFSGKSNNPVSQMLSQAEIGVTVTRGTMSASGQPGVLTVNTPLNGSIRITGQIGASAGKAVGGLGGTIGGLLGGSGIGKQIGDIAGKALDQNTDFHGNVVVTSRPQITSAWRIEPNLAGRLDFRDTGTNVGGIKMNLGSEIKSLLEPAINNQVSALQTRLRNDPIIERTVREQWVKMCRSIPLGGEKTGLPPLWLEMRPIRAAAAQPQIDAQNLTLTIGVQAETRIVPNETKPDCPFPAQLELVPPMQEGVLAVGVPIDMPFTELNKLLEPQLKGRRFPEDGSGPVDVEVLRASLAASGERLLISLRVKAREKKSWFGFGTEATVHIWGKPQLDQQNQILRLTDMSLAVESEAAFGLLGAAARAAVPHMQKALADKAQIDLKPFANDARAKIAAALKEFQQVGDGVQVDANVIGLRLTGIEFDARTLRIIAEANGNVRVAVTQLPKM